MGLIDFLRVYPAYGRRKAGFPDQRFNPVCESPFQNPHPEGYSVCHNHTKRYGLPVGVCLRITGGSLQGVAYRMAVIQHDPCAFPVKLISLHNPRFYRTASENYVP